MAGDEHIKIEPRKSTGEENLTRITSLEVPEKTIRIPGEKEPVMITIPTAKVTTNLPIQDISGISLQEKIPVLGFSSERYRQNREDLKGADNRVIIADYVGVGRVIMLNRPSEREYHTAQDACSAVITVSASLSGEQRVMFTGVVADGNTSTWIEKDFFDPKKHKKADAKGKHVLIQGFASAGYADLAARNVHRFAAMPGSETVVVEKMVDATSRIDYVYEYGGAVASILNAEVTKEGLIVNQLNLGERKDLGKVIIPGKSGAESLSMVGNEQDLSFQGRVSLLETKYNYSAKNKSTPRGVIQITCDGAQPLPDRLTGGVLLKDALLQEPEDVVAFLSKTKLMGTDKDDQSVVIFVPYEETKDTLKIPVAEASTPTVITAGEAMPVFATEEAPQANAEDFIVSFDEASVGPLTNTDTPGPTAEVARAESQEELLAVLDLLDRYYRNGEEISIEELAATAGYRIPSKEERARILRNDVELTLTQNAALDLFAKMLNIENVADITKMDKLELLEKSAQQIQPLINSMLAARELLDTWKSGKQVRISSLADALGYKPMKKNIPIEEK